MDFGEGCDRRVTIEARFHREAEPVLLSQLIYILLRDGHGNTMDGAVIYR